MKNITDVLPSYPPPTLFAIRHKLVRSVLDSLQTFFHRKGYHVRCMTDRKSTEMKGEIRAFARDISQSKPSIAAIFICSHADCGHPYGSDGNQISLEHDVFAPLEETNLPEMKGKPKLVFIQACQKIKRGKNVENNILFYYFVHA